MSDRPADLEIGCLLGEGGTLLRAPRRALPPGLAENADRHMRRIRRLDERMITIQRQGRIGFYGACVGQEGVAVGAALALGPTDWVFPALRESSVALVRGLPLELYLAQLFGNHLDPMKGRQMPSHHGSRRFFHVSWSSAIATQLPHAVGAAYASRYLRRPDVMLAFLGDGATSHPDFHAALNFAGVFRAKVVFVCQNNQYALSLPAARQTAASSFAIKARAYGVEPERVDGNDVLAVFESVSLALERARDGQGPSLIECVTYRLGPHSTSDDPSLYRPQSELDRYRELDPILRLRRYLVQAGGQSATESNEVERQLDAELDGVLTRIEAARPPARDSLFDDVYAELSWPLIEQRAQLRGSEHSGG